MTLGHIPGTRAAPRRAGRDEQAPPKARPARLLGWTFAGLLSLGLWLTAFGLVRALV